MEPFLDKFFPEVSRKMNATATEKVNQYCKYESQTLTMFTSSLYLAALLSSLVASPVTRTFGRRLSMLAGGLLFFAGAIINASAKVVWTLIIGRVLLGFGIGFTNQVLQFLGLFMIFFYSFFVSIMLAWKKKVSISSFLRKLLFLLSGLLGWL